MDNRPFHAVWRVHCQDGQLSEDFFPQSLLRNLSALKSPLAHVFKEFNLTILQKGTRFTAIAPHTTKSEIGISHINHSYSLIIISKHETSLIIMNPY